MATGIRDKVAIIGMGCSKFGERWDMGAEELMVEAYTEGIADAGLETKDIEAAWLSTCLEEISVGKSALAMPAALRLEFIPVTRTENFCASGTEAFRGAVYAVANPGSDWGSLNWLWWPNLTAPGAFAQLASAYSARYGIKMTDIKRALAHISVKSHKNGVLNPKAHLRKAVTEDQVMGSPMIASPLGLFDCCGVSDGAACAIVTTVENAKRLGHKDFVTVKSLQLSLSNGEEMAYNDWDGSYFKTTTIASKKAYAEAGIQNPREELSMMEVHDCFSITEMCTYEDLHISPRGGCIKDIMDGFYDLDGGGVPCQVDGGLKCFGHPIGASGIRMIYEMYLQLHGRADQRQLENPKFGLTHNLGGLPFQNVCSIAIVGKYDG